LKREQKTVERMVGIYCRDHQHTKGEYPTKGHKHPARGYELCHECSDLVEYARFRLQNCPFQENKTTCGNCPIHCYKPKMREKIREVMRYAGPRMIWSHPLLAIGHMIDGRRKKPGPKKGK
jgi:hypothetical protein